MRKIDKIKNMPIEELARFLICESISEEVDYDYEENAYATTHSCYVTPFCEYDYWWDYDDVLEDTMACLLAEDEDDETE